MTFLPRHSVLYLPFSLLAGRQDRLSIHIHVDATPPGRGHIVEATQYRHGWIQVDDAESMSRSDVTAGDRSYHILCYNPLVRDRLRSLLERLPASPVLRHFAYDASDRSCLIELQPDPTMLESTLRSILELLPSFAREPL
ncbi:hypothetical protein, partial [Salinispira pacifica]